MEIDCEIRPDEDCYGDGLYDYCLGLCGASGWVLGNSMQGHYLIGTNRNIFRYGTKQPGRWFWWRGQPWGFLPFFPIQTSQTEMPFHSVRRGVRRGLIYIFHFSFQGAQSPPSLPHIWKPAKSGQSLDSHLVAYFSFLSCQIFLVLVFWGGGRTEVPRTYYIFFVA